MGHKRIPVFVSQSTTVYSLCLERNEVSSASGLQLHLLETRRRGLRGLFLSRWAAGSCRCEAQGSGSARGGRPGCCGAPALKTAAPCRPWGSPWKAPARQGQVRTPAQPGLDGKSARDGEPGPACRPPRTPGAGARLRGARPREPHPLFNCAGAQPHHTGSTVFTFCFISAQ